jgi:hypothetical protein
MNYILRGYSVNEPTWFYLSLLLIIAVFFRFGRLWSLRNLDLGLLLSIAPALLIAPHLPAFGYLWLFIATGLLLTRVILDALFTRRPRFPQNMNAAGLTFLCAAAFAFLMTKVMAEPPPASTVQEVRRAKQLLQGGAPAALTPQDAAHVPEAGPGSHLIYAAVIAPSNAVVSEAPGEFGAYLSEQVAARTMAILAHLGVVSGLICLGYWHFGDVQLGLAMATLYLLLPCTAFEVGKVNHVLPAALIVWAFVAYRRVLLSGCLIGLACGTLFFPVFLLPLWVGFYGKRGAVRFSLALGVVALLLVSSYLLTANESHSFVRHTFGEIDWGILQFREMEPAGFWSLHPAAYRIPVFVSFLALLVALTIWPRKKNLGDLMAHSASIVIAIQFWYPQQGGVYVLWYLPILLMVVFRPQLNTHFPPELKRLRAAAGEQPKASQPQLLASSATTGQLFR